MYVCMYVSLQAARQPGSQAGCVSVRRQRCWPGSLYLITQRLLALYFDGG